MKEREQAREKEMSDMRLKVQQETELRMKAEASAIEAARQRIEAETKAKQAAVEKLEAENKALIEAQAKNEALKKAS